MIKLMKKLLWYGCTKELSNEAFSIGLIFLEDSTSCLRFCLTLNDKDCRTFLIKFVLKMFSFECCLGRQSSRFLLIKINIGNELLVNLYVKVQARILLHNRCSSQNKIY